MSKLYLLCNKCADWNWNLFDVNALQSIHPSYDVWFFFFQGIPAAGCTLVSGLHVHQTAVLRWVGPTTPAEPAFLWPNPFAYRLYDCIWACPSSTGPWRSTIQTLQPVPGTRTRRVLHEWGQWTPHSCWWRVPCASRNWLPTVKKAHFVAGEYGDTTLRIKGPAVGQRDSTSRV